MTEDWMTGRYAFIAVYILASSRHGTLYVGSTNDLPRRMHEHHEGVFPGFTRTYDVKRLVWCEPHDLMTEAIRREKAIKGWRREWKINLIERENPDWNDLQGSLI